MRKFKFLFFLPLLFCTSLQATELYTTAVQKGLSDMLNPNGKFATLKFSDGTTQTTASGGASSVAFSAVTGSATSNQLPLISGLLGSATTAQLPLITQISGTLTAQSIIGTNTATFGTSTPGSCVVNIYNTSLNLLRLQNNTGTNTASTNDAIGTMTSNTSPAPQVASVSSTQDGTHVAWKAFDKDGASEPSRWLSADPSSATEWIKIDLGATNTANVITKYSLLMTTETTTAPRDWTFDGSNNDSTWTTIDTRSNITGWEVDTYRNFTFANTNAYRYYRLNITDDNGSTYREVGEWKLYPVLVPAADSDIVYVNQAGIVMIGTSTPNSTTTSYLLQIAGSGLATSWGVTCYESIKSIIGSGTDVVKEGYDAVMGTKLFKHHPKIMTIDIKEAEAKTKAEYVNSFVAADFETFKTDRLGSYTTYVAGSATVNWIQFEKDFQEQYVKPREDEFYVLADKNKRVKDKKVSLESDTSITNISPVSDDPSTPAIFKRGDPKILDLENQIGALIGTVQYQAVEIKDLKNRMGIP